MELLLRRKPATDDGLFVPASGRGSPRIEWCCSSGERSVQRPSTIETFCQGRGVNTEMPGPLRQRSSYTVKRDSSEVMAIIYSRGRLGQCFRQWPALIQTRSQGTCRNPRGACPFGERPRLTLPGQTAIRPFVVLLLSARGPAAIIRRVGAVIVDAVEGMLWTRTRSHITNECAEVAAPLFAHANPAGAVQSPALRAGRMASAERRFPDQIFGAAIQPMFRHPLKAETPAAGGIARPQRVHGDARITAAIAATPVSPVATYMAVRRGHSEAPESLPGQIDGFHGIRLYAGAA